MLFDEEPRYLVLYGGRGSAKSWGAAQRAYSQGDGEADADIMRPYVPKLD